MSTATLSPSFIATLRQQSWYPTIASEMQNKNVPEWLWASVIADEDQSLDPNAAILDTNGKTSYGLFQLNGNPNGTDPTYAGKWAATRLGNEIAYHTELATPNPSPATVKEGILAAEEAAWPGSTSGYGATELPDRLALATQVVGQEQQSPTQYTTGSFWQNLGSGFQAYIGAPVVSNALTNQTASSQTATQNAISGATTSLQNTLSNLATQAFIGGVIIAVIAGGFALMSQE